MMKNLKSLLCVLILAVASFGLVACGEEDPPDIEPTTLTIEMVSLEYTSVTYDGEAKIPSVTITLDGNTVPSTEYTTSYTDNINVGTASVLVSAVDNSEVITGSVSVTFVIAPPPITSDDWDGSIDTSWYSAGITSYTFTTAEELAGLASLVNDGNDFSGVTITMQYDFNLSIADWTPIGSATRSGNSIVGNSFAGTFDGNNKSIVGMKLGIVTGSDAVGLFGAVTGTVKNVNIKTSTITTASKNAGLIAGLVKGGTIDNCTTNADSSITAPDGVGGLIGRVLVEGVISNCTNNAVVSSSEAAGGIVGKAYYSDVDKYITISNCSNTATISGIYASAGIAGLSSANISSCTNSGAINSNTLAGGIVAEQTCCGKVENSTNTATINLTNGTTAGGIIGYARYAGSSNDYKRIESIIVSGNTNSGNILASNCTLGAGGIVGTIYNQATVTGNTNTCATITGGIFGAGIVANLQLESNNHDIAGANIVVTGNTYEMDTIITATCVDDVAYKNDDSFVVSDNIGA